MTEMNIEGHAEPPPLSPELQIQRADWMASDDMMLRGSKAMYFGDAGSVNWLGVTAEPTYPLDEKDRFSLRNLRGTAVDGLVFNSLVSFGPGDGLHDAALLCSMRPVIAGGYNRPRYLPIDISWRFLRRSAAAAERIADVPVAIQCDFEQDQALMQSAIETHTSVPVLFGMLGGTFANLELGEEQFLGWLCNCMRANDGFLVDIPTAGPGWNLATEPRLQAESYSEPFRRFLAFGIARGESDAADSLEIRAGAVLLQFEERVRFSHQRNANTGAEEITVSDSRSGRIILIFRRYRFDLLRSWIEKHGFVIQSAIESERMIENQFGMGVILVRTAP